MRAIDPHQERERKQVETLSATIAEERVIMPESAPEEDLDHHVEIEEEMIEAGQDLTLGVEETDTRTGEIEDDLEVMIGEMTQGATTKIEETEEGIDISIDVEREETLGMKLADQHHDTIRNMIEKTTEAAQEAEEAIEMARIDHTLKKDL